MLQRGRRVWKAGLVMCFWALLAGAGLAAEPTRPNVNHTFDSGRERKISNLTRSDVPTAFTGFQSMDFLTNKNFLDTGIYRAFGNRKQTAIPYALEKIKAPRIKIVDGAISSEQNNDFYVAKEILQVFPSESVGSLISLYNSSADPAVRANVICVLGKMEGGQEIRDLLIQALDDKTYCEEEVLEMAGKPLRICDEAYNQLVLRYRVKDVLRCIGNAHSIDVRDYQIEALKNLL